MSSFDQPIPQSIAYEQTLLRRVYNWMAAGLGLSGVIAYYLMRNEELIRSFVASPMRFWGIFIAQLALVLFLSSRIARMSVATATFMFFLYAGLNGLALSPIFLVYTQGSIAAAFLSTGGMFAAASLWGTVTKRSLSTWGHYLTMALLGFMVALIVNFWLHSSILDLAISVAMVILGVGLTAYDTQRIKMLSGSFGSDGEMETRAAILGAFSLYLDFVMMFVYALRLMGRRR